MESENIIDYIVKLGINPGDTLYILRCERRFFVEEAKVECVTYACDGEKTCAKIQVSTTSGTEVLDSSCLNITLFKSLDLASDKAKEKQDELDEENKKIKEEARNLPITDIVSASLCCIHDDMCDKCPLRTCNGTNCVAVLKMALNKILDALK